MDTYKKNFTILELEVFSLLCTRAAEKLSQREIAQILEVSPTAVGSTIKKLLKKELIQLEKTKTINFITFNRENPKAIALKRVENIKNIYISGFAEFLEEKLAGATILVFGSYARGEDTKTSDIDIAVIGRKNKALNVEEFEKICNRKIHLNFYDSWKEIHKHLKDNILNGILLQGSVEL